MRITRVNLKLQGLNFYLFSLLLFAPLPVRDIEPQCDECGNEKQQYDRAEPGSTHQPSHPARGVSVARVGLQVETSAYQLHVVILY